MKWSRAPLELGFFFFLKKKRISSVLALAPSPPNSAGGGAGLGPQLNLHTCVSWLPSHKLHGCCAGRREQINTKSLHSLGQSCKYILYFMSFSFNMGKAALFLWRQALVIEVLSLIGSGVPRSTEWRYWSLLMIGNWKTWIRKKKLGGN